MQRPVKAFVVRDEVHGDLVLDPIVRCVVDQDVFQRLRFIKQAGLAEYVFPGSTHTRFQHSLGAAHLAGAYFDSLFASWSARPFRFDGTVGRTRFFGTKTADIVARIQADESSLLFWRRVVVLAALLHDVGHGPWSHAFENLPIRQDFAEPVAKLPRPIRDHYQALIESGGRFWHEDLSILYGFQVFAMLEREKLVDAPAAMALAVAGLVHRKLFNGPFGTQLREAIQHALDAAKIVGGLDAHRLFSPIVSGPFDVDRMDYMQRDARNCGVSIGGIEWTRIIRKVLPCLADHQNDFGEPSEVVLVSHVKNQHVLDDFVFSLFQMYAQVYMHPKIVGIEETIRALLEKGIPKESDYTLTLDEHRSLTDERFRWMLREKFGITAVDDLLFRRRPGQFRIVTYPTGDPDFGRELAARGYEPLPLQERPMWKDGVGVFLYSDAVGVEHLLLREWTAASPVAGRFRGLMHAPQFWILRSAE